MVLDKIRFRNHGYGWGGLKRMLLHHPLSIWWMFVRFYDFLNERVYRGLDFLDDVRFRLMEPALGRMKPVEPTKTGILLEWIFGFFPLNFVVGPVLTVWKLFNLQDVNIGVWKFTEPNNPQIVDDILAQWTPSRVARFKARKPLKRLKRQIARQDKYLL